MIRIFSDVASRKYLVLLVLLSTFCLPSFLVRTANADFDISRVGTLGKKTIVCVRSGEENTFRFDRGEALGKEKSFGVVNRSIKKALGKIKSQLKQLKGEKGKRAKKKKSKLKLKRQALSELKATARKCRENTLPLELLSDSDSLRITIPLSALPEELDPAEISITPLEALDELIDGPDLLAAYQLEPDGLQLLEEGTVFYTLPAPQEGDEGVFLWPGVLHISTHEDGLLQHEWLQPSIVNADEDDTELKVSLPLGHFSKIGVTKARALDSKDALSVTAEYPTEAVVQEPFSVDVNVSVKAGVIARTAVARDRSVGPFSEPRAVVLVEKTTSKRPWKMEGSFSHFGPGTRVIEPLPRYNTPDLKEIGVVGVDEFQESFEFTCTSDTSGPEAFSYLTIAQVSADATQVLQESGEELRPIKDTFFYAAVYARMAVNCNRPEKPLPTEFPTPTPTPPFNFGAGMKMITVNYTDPCPTEEGSYRDFDITINVDGGAVNLRYEVRNVETNELLKGKDENGNVVDKPICPGADEEVSTSVGEEASGTKPYTISIRSRSADSADPPPTLKVKAIWD